MPDQRLADARIIVIDDHFDLVENLREILEDEGGHVFAASSAAEGLKLAQHPFDVALVDVRLPDARGPALLPQLKQGDALQEVLLVTGHASIQDAIEAVKAGAFAYVLKPFNSEELVTNVERALEQVRLKRKTAILQRALERGEAALRTMVNTVQALLLVLDDSGTVVQVNQAVAVAAGVSVESLLGCKFIDRFVPQRDQKALYEACVAARNGGAGKGIQTAVLHHTDGSIDGERTISWRLSGLSEGDGWLTYISGLDVTEFRDLERRTRLAEKLAAVGTVSAGLAHEIRNPLNAASLQLQLLERRLAKTSSDARLQQTIDTVQAEIERLSRLVTEFLAFARPQALRPKPMDLAKVAQRVVALEQPVAQQRDIQLSFSGPKTEVTIDGDSGRLQQVVLNLLRNALDAVGEGGKILVGVENDGAGGRLTVHDNGPGIPEEIKARIFEPFFTTKETGTGLGMAISHSVIQLHGGTIEVFTDEGTKFVVSIPRHPPGPV